MRAPALVALIAALASTSCLDWDELRGARTGDAGTGTDARPADPAPIVRWTFGGAGPVTAVTDDAPAAPDVPLVLAADAVGSATTTGGWLRLEGAELSAPATARQALASALAAGSGLTVELWLDPIDTLASDAFLSVLGLSVRLLEDGFVAALNAGDVAYDAGPAGSSASPVHVAVTVAADKLTLFIGGDPVSIQNLDTPFEPDARILHLGTEGWNGRIGLVAIYDRVLGFNALKARAERSLAPP